ncbi:MAG: lipase family protein [Prochlorothrix sp.]
MDPLTSVYRHFNPAYHSPGYHPRDAYAMGLASALAYEPEAEVKRVLTAWGFTKTHWFSKKRGRTIDTQGFIAIGDTTIVVAFRGSESKADWLTNLQARTDPGCFTGSEVHGGFRDAIFPVFLELGAILGQEHRQGQEKSVWVTGHNLGGALATLLIAMLTVADGDCEALVDFQFGGLYTFGAPRVGDRNFAEALDTCPRLQDRLFRVVNFGDPVPQLPRTYMGFQHGGRVISIDDQDQVRQEAPSAQSRFQAFRQWVGYVAQPDFQTVQSHQMRGEYGYLTALQRASQGIDRG